MQTAPYSFSMHFTSFFTPHLFVPFILHRLFPHWSHIFFSDVLTASFETTLGYVVMPCLPAFLLGYRLPCRAQILCNFTKVAISNWAFIMTIGTYCTSTLTGQYARLFLRTKRHVTCATIRDSSGRRGDCQWHLAAVRRGRKWNNVTGVLVA